MSISPWTPPAADAAVSGPAGVAPASSAFLDDLSASLGALVDASTLSRALYSTDASNYRVVPQAVVTPRSREDVVAAVAVSRRHGVPITARGGGTSCAGNAIGPGLVLDFSRFMNRILRVDPEAATAVVEPGVVLSTLQEAAQPFGLRFGPDPSTATRCTIGGMLGNNACGPHGLAYGRTSDNVVSMTWLTGQGEVITASLGASSLDAVPGLGELVAENLAVLRTEFGRFGRQISGYSLEHLLPENGGSLAAALVGTEGSCGILLEAVVRLVPRAPAPALAVLGYDDMAVAADDVPNLLPFRPLALEGLDRGLIDVVRRAQRSGTPVPALPRGGGWLMVEVGGDTSDAAVRAAQKLVASSHSLDAVILPAGPEATRLWQIRADGAGLAGRTATGEQAWPGWEDSAVPPERLGDYLRGLEALMNEESVSGVAYGHFGDGCVHLRIDFPLEAGSAVMRRFLERAAALAAAHGGSLSGEHGDGRARSELLTSMYSPEALRVMERFKALLDPDDVMNPGVVVRPAPLDADLRRPQALPLLATGGFAFADDGGDITRAVHRCVGVGKCRAELRDQGGFMCPSYTATRDERDSTRGRARVLQEMLNGGVVSLGWSSPEVHEALDLCLSCKACANDCPTGIDMATFKSETLFRTYQGRRRPLSHYTLGRLPQWLRLAAPFAPLINLLGKVPVLRRTTMRMIGADARRSLPSLPLVPFRWTRAARRRTTDPRQHEVLLWVDSFSDALAPDIPAAALEVLSAAGCDVQVAGPGACCGLTLISTGQLTAAKATLRRTLDVLAPQVAAGRTIVGLEPSCTATLRSDLLELLPDDPRSAEVSAAVKTLAEFLTSIGWEPPRAEQDLLVQPHCHHYAVMGYGTDQALLEAMGCDVEISAGCCGLAGNFGMEKGHYDVSQKIAEAGILAKAAAAPGRQIVADGFSCRTQVGDLAGLGSRHLAQVLADALRADERGRS